MWHLQRFPTGKVASTRGFCPPPSTKHLLETSARIREEDGAQNLIDQMVADDLSPKTISNYFQVVRMVFSSCVDEDGQELYPRNWKRMGLIMPRVNKKEQRRPCFTKNVMNHLANSKTIKPKMRMLFILCGATGLRLGEVLGIRIEKVFDNGSRIIY
jgi:integrase